MSFTFQLYSWVVIIPIHLTENNVVLMISPQDILLNSD